MTIFNDYASIPEMTDCTPFSRPDGFNIPLEESIEALIEALLILSLVASNECL